MATGVINSNYEKTRKYCPITVSYEGKKEVTKILNQKHNKYKETEIVNGENGESLFYGNNLDALLYLLNNGMRGKIQLVYIDPPFATELSFYNKDQKLAYDDMLSGGEYVEFIRERLLVIYELLADNGSIYVHLDGKMASTIQLILNEIFGEDNCRAFITRKKCSTKNSTTKTYGNISDYIMFYSKSKNYIWNRPYKEWDYESLITQYPYIDEATQRRYKKVPIHAPGVRNGETGKPWRGKLPPKGKHWQYTPEKLDELDAKGEIYWSPTGNPRRKVFSDQSQGIPIQDIWMDYRDSINQAQKTTGYPTEKNIEMLKLIVEASSNEGDTVLDCFAGSGTTLDAAFQLGRHWIGMDNSQESINAIKKRFTHGLEPHGDYVNKKKATQSALDFDNKCHFSIYTADKNISTLRV